MKSKESPKKGENLGISDTWHTRNKKKEAESDTPLTRPCQGHDGGCIPLFKVDFDHFKVLFISWYVGHNVLGEPIAT